MFARIVGKNALQKLAVRPFTTTTIRLGEKKPLKPQGYVQGKHVNNYYLDKNNNLVVKVKPLPRENESIDQKRRRLLYQSRKRGILETDLLLSRFADRYIMKMGMKELEEYDKLLDEMDWDIYYWATKNYNITPIPDRWKNSEVMKKLQELSNNSTRAILRMPELNKEEMTMGDKKN